MCIEHASRKKQVPRLWSAIKLFPLCVLLGGLFLSAGYAFASTSEDSLISAKRPATSSTRENSFWCRDCTARKAVDGNTKTRWASAYADRQWLQVDLGAGAEIHRIILVWDAAYAKAYEIQVSNNRKTWTSLYSTTNGQGGVEELTVSGKGRYIRLYAITRGTIFGFSLIEFQVYGIAGGSSATPTEESTPIVGTTPTAEITPTEEATPTEESTPTAEITPTEEATPTAEITPTIEATSTVESTPTEEATPTAEVTPTEGSTPTVGITPTVGTTPIVATTPTAPAGWHILWNDEFNGAAGTGPDSNKWVADVGGGGWGNQEREYYTKNDNAKQDGNGNLVIEARKENPANYQCWYGTCQYTSARLTTLDKFDFTYGRVEARIKIPSGQGIWPALWMMGNNIASVGWPNNGEVDIFENIGREPSTVHGTVHGPGYSGANGIGGPYSLQSGKFADDYHLFAVEWNATQIAFFVDGNKYFTVTKATVEQHGRWAYDHPFYLLLNVAVGGTWPGDPDGSSTYPQKMYVDYIRVFQQN
jgi:beta-glucanase (GH16 family)